LFEEDVRHPIVVVLPRVDENLLVPLTELVTQRARLDELRPCAEDGGELHCSSGTRPARMGTRIGAASSGCRRANSISAPKRWMPPTPSPTVTHSRPKGA